MVRSGQCRPPGRAAWDWLEGRIQVELTYQTDRDCREDEMHLNEYQFPADQTDQQPYIGDTGIEHRGILVSLLGLAGEVGELLGEHKKWLRDGDSYSLFTERVREELGDLLWCLSNMATKHGLTLGEITGHNLDEMQRRCNVSVGGEKGPKLLNGDLPESECIPRKKDVSIDTGRPSKVEIFINGKAFGHSLSDNRYEEDGYRFHDLLHLAYGTVLGWSPTLKH